MEQLPDLDLPLAPGWSLALGVVGRVLVIFASCSFLLSALAWLFGERSSLARRSSAWLFGLGAGGVFGTFAVLATLFVTNRFEYEYVYGHGDLRNAIPYKIAGVWSGQEGSFLLWAVTSALFALLALRSAGPYRRGFGIAAATFLAALTGILAFESPFDLNLIHGKAFVPPDGVGLTPALQNYWVVIHPPTIFLGFGSLIVPFALAFAAMWRSDFSDWGARVRPWALVSLALVGLGLCMGGLWAYETLGWGGFWAWDPVENTSFVPWCLTAALVHGLIVQATRGHWHASNLLLSGLPFLSFLYGTFLTRSGFLGETSVHSFAEMDRTALWMLLGMLGVCSLGFFVLWLIRLRAMPAGNPTPLDGEQPIRRENLYRIGSILLLATALAAGFGMSMPMFMSITGKQPKVVEEWLYHQILPWMFIPVMILSGAAPFVGWRGIGLRQLLGRLYGIVCISFALTGLTMVVLMRGPWGRLADLDAKLPMPFGMQVQALPWIMFLAGLCYFVLVANVWRIAESWKRSRTSLATFLSHVGLGVLLAGLIVSRGLERKEQIVVQEGVPRAALGYVLDVKEHTRDLTDRDNKVLIEVTGGGESFVARPGLYYVITPEGEANPMAWPHIQRHLTHDIYLTLHPMVFNASDRVTLNPGESTTLEPFKVTYLGLTREGEAGTAGAKFGARLRLESGETQFEVEPKLQLTREGLAPIPADVDADYYISMSGMDAATKSATIQLNYRRPIYPIEIFYKPLTWLVWIGMGILALGGLLAAGTRRFRVRESASVDVEPALRAHPEVAHATAPTP